MSEIEKLKQYPIQDDELLGCTVAVFILEDLRNVVEELREEREALRHEREFFRANNELMAGMLYEVLGEFQRRKWVDRMNLKNQRLAARHSLALWFWRPESEDVLTMVCRRADYLARERNCSLDDTWTLLQEFLSDHAKASIPDAELKAIVVNAYSGKGAADASAQ